MSTHSPAPSSTAPACGFFMVCKGTENRGAENDTATASSHYTGTLKASRRTTAMALCTHVLLLFLHVSKGMEGYNKKTTDAASYGPCG